MTPPLNRACASRRILVLAITRVSGTGLMNEWAQPPRRRIGGKRGRSRHIRAHRRVSLMDRLLPIRAFCVCTCMLSGGRAASRRSSGAHAGYLSVHSVVTPDVMRFL
jgi:hypothetical protein